jgi:hypothetical protein
MPYLSEKPAAKSIGHPSKLFQKVDAVPFGKACGTVNWTFKQIFPKQVSWTFTHTFPKGRCRTFWKSLRHSQLDIQANFSERSQFDIIQANFSERSQLDIQAHFSER